MAVGVMETHKVATTWRAGQVSGLVGPVRVRLPKLNLFRNFLFENIVKNGKWPSFERFCSVKYSLLLAANIRNIMVILFDSPLKFFWLNHCTWFGEYRVSRVHSIWLKFWIFRYRSTQKSAQPWRRQSAGAHTALYGTFLRISSATSRMYSAHSS